MSEPCEVCGAVDSPYCAVCRRLIEIRKWREAAQANGKPDSPGPPANLSTRHVLDNYQEEYEIERAGNPLGYSEEYPYYYY